MGDQEENDAVDLQIDGTRFPRRTLGMIAAFWFFVFFIALLKGGEDTPSIFPFVSCNNTGYWSIQIFCWASMFIVFVFVRRQVLFNLLGNGAGGLDGDVVWTPRNSVTIPLVCLPCGLGAG